MKIAITSERQLWAVSKVFIPLIIITDRAGSREPSLRVACLGHTASPPDGNIAATRMSLGCF